MKNSATKPVLPAPTDRPHIHARHPDPGKRTVSALTVRDDTAELLLYDDIGEFWGMGTSAESVIDQLGELDDSIKNLTVRINSPGGDVFDGAAIYNALARQRIPVDVQIDGVAASIASIIAMAGDTITIASNAMMMVHNPWMMSMGDAAVLRSDATLLDQVRSGMTRIYTARTGQPEGVIEAIMDAETWMTAAEAVDQGFADETTEPVGAAARANLADYPYKHVPDGWDEPPAPVVDYRSKVAALAGRIRKR